MPLVMGNPLAALGCYLEGATLYVQQVPVPATEGQKEPVHAGCVCQSSGNHRTVGGSETAWPPCGTSALGQAQSPCVCEMRRTPVGRRVECV